jgi:hypothetical protein
MKEVVCQIKVLEGTRLRSIYIMILIKPSSTMRVFSALIILSLFLVVKNTYAQAILTGTTVVAVRTKTEVVVGADSKMVAIGDNLEDAGQTCKIIQVDNLFFAHARLIRDSWGSFSVPETVLQARRKGGTILETANNFEKMIVPSLTKILMQMKREHPAFFQKHYEGGSAVDIVFFGIEKDVPVLYMRYFVASSSADGSVSIEVRRLNCPGDCPGGLTYAFLGEQSALNRFLDANPHYSRNGWIPTINKLIEVEASDKPDFVSLPVDILRVDKNGAEWLQKKPQCPEIKKYR